MKERVQTEHNLAAQAVYEHLFDIFIYFFSILHFVFTCTFTFNT